MMELSLSQARSSLRSHPSSSDSLAFRRKYLKLHHVQLSKFSVPRTLKQAQSKSLFCASKKNTTKVFCSQKPQTPVLEARSIEEVYDSLAERLLLSTEKLLGHNSKYIIGLAGPPGAGKSTLASEVVCRFNTLLSQSTMKFNSAQDFDIATVLPMDGFHLYRSQLDAMENPKEAHARRGAPWTFNPELLLKRLRALRSEGSVYVPSFDHGVGDPVEDDIFIRPEHKVVIVEGNYLLLEEGTWQEVCSVFDEKWFIDIDIDTAMQRVFRRHISTGKEPDIARWRIEYNDRPNAELIMKSKEKADLIIKSVDFSS